QSRKLLLKPSSRFCLTNFPLSKSIKMQFIKFVALVGLLAGGALAAPTDKPDKPQKPPKPAPPPPPPTQQNACGNGANGEDKGSSIRQSMSMACQHQWGERLENSRDLVILDGGNDGFRSFSSKRDLQE
ncbi:MAG: hypothetical protein Q9204_003874, partial [Flavoplaca sp. TL-2023a]